MTTASRRLPHSHATRTSAWLPWPLTISTFRAVVTANWTFIHQPAMVDQLVMPTRTLWTGLTFICATCYTKLSPHTEPRLTSALHRYCAQGTSCATQRSQHPPSDASGPFLCLSNGWSSGKHMPPWDAAGNVSSATEVSVYSCVAAKVTVPLVIPICGPTCAIFIC